MAAEGRRDATGRSRALAPAWPPVHALGVSAPASGCPAPQTPRRESGSRPLLRRFKRGDLQVQGGEAGSCYLPRVPQIVSRAARGSCGGRSAPWGGGSRWRCRWCRVALALLWLRFRCGAARVAGQGTAQGTSDPSCAERVVPGVWGRGWGTVLDPGYTDTRSSCPNTWVPSSSDMTASRN